MEEDIQVIPIAQEIDDLFDGLSRAICFRILDLVTKKILCDIVKERIYTPQAKADLITFFKIQHTQFLKIMEQEC